jgi:c(7)-type cytochrome triheme protein
MKNTSVSRATLAPLTTPLACIFAALLAAFFITLFSAAHAADAPNGKALFDKTCAPCHLTGAAGAPKLGDSAAWAPRVKTGVAALFNSATKGKGVMPPRGGNAALTDDEIRAIVGYMVAQAGPAPKAEKAEKTDKPAIPAAPGAKAEAPPPKPAATVAAAAAPAMVPGVAPAAAPAPAAAAVAAAPAIPASGVNTFNRLMKPELKGNLPPPEDGAHDPVNDGTHSLQPPLTAFSTLSKSNTGNRVDWVKSLDEQSIKPRSDRNDPSVAPMVMDMNIIREVKGSMPDVVYPHKQHTQWLDCSNCHPAIFIPQKGANQISMAAILLGQKCGVCHGKVAFPVSECRRCHSKSKPGAAAPEAKP